MSISEAIRRVYDNLRGRLIVPHQTEGVRWMFSRELCIGVKGGILADEMGLGKSIMAISMCIGNPLPNPTLIVVPKSLVRQWVSECTKFSGIRPLVIRSSDLKRLDPHHLAGIRIAITTYDTLRHKDQENVLMTTHWGRIIVDEGHAIKNPNSKRTIAAKKVRGDIKWCLTGTPVTRVKKDFKTIMEWIGVDSLDYKMMYETYTLRRTFEDASKQCERLRLPPLRLNVHPVTLRDASEIGLYKDLAFEASLRIAVYEQGIRSKDNTINDIVEVILRLRQTIVHPALVYTGRKMGEWTGGTSRLDELEKLISAQPRHSKTLVFTHWNIEADAIVQRLQENLGLSVRRIYGGMSLDDRTDIMHEFNTGTSIDALVLHIEIGGVGLNLQAATHVYINSLDWSPSTELQAIARAHRIGVDHVVTATRLVVQGTIDEYILNMHDTKLGHAAEVLQDNRIREKLHAIGLQDLKKIRQYLECNLS